MKNIFIAAIMLMVFANPSKACWRIASCDLSRKPGTLIEAMMRKDTINPGAKPIDTITPKAKKDTITPVIVRHDTVAMSTKHFNHILNLMRQKKNDAQKIRAIKTGLKLAKGKGLKLEQLKTLLNQFLNDSSKLSMAEYAYPYTVDWQGFPEIYNLFSTQDSKDKLDDFLRHHK